mmetsp:Transcript_93567/g.244017  ORF Transcript_93567/g.244017 Transcript_93567/m.244017 type:complete len:294 (-) Transcript_93567:87-968(-)
MGICGSKKREEVVSFRETDGEIKLLIVALNYEYVQGAELTCHEDAHIIFRIADRAHCCDITLNTDRRGIGGLNFPTRSVVLKHVEMVASRCKPGDWFVWFWAGHGVSVPHRSGNGDFDQAFVTPDEKGRLTEKSVLLDDEFAEALETYVPEGVRILCICDCCHSGSICDVDSYKYTHEIYQFSASQDNEEAEDIGGGVLSIAMKRAVRQLSLKYPHREFSIQEAFDLSKKNAQKVTCEQELSFQWSGTDPRNVAWPLGYAWTEYAKDIPRRRVDIFDLEHTEDVLKGGDSDGD